MVIRPGWDISPQVEPGSVGPMATEGLAVAELETSTPMVLLKEGLMALDRDVNGGH